MLPYPTTRRRLLMMVRTFLHRFEDFVGMQGCRCPADPPPDRELQAFLERLAMEADEDDASISLWAGAETEGEIVQSVEEHLRDLLHRASRDEVSVSEN